MEITGMNKVIGITGYMSVGKSYVLSKLLSQINKDYVLIDVDIFRRKLLKENSEYVKELKLVIPELNDFNEIDSVILNKYIYSNGTYMEEYKKILYKYLFDYIDSLQNKLIFIEWALIINDNLIKKECIVYLKRSNNFYSLKQTSGIDINAQIQQEKEKR